MQTKHKLLALAMAAALAPMSASAADVVFSGVVRGVATISSQKDSAGKTNDMLVNINRARLRVDAKQALDGGMNMGAYVRFQTADGASGAAPTVGQSGMTLSGAFGTVVVQGNGDSGGYGDINGKLDVFEQGSISDRLFVQQNSASNVLGYASPNFNGVVVKAALLTDNNSYGTSGTDPEVKQGTDFDAKNIRLTYTGGPLYVGFSYLMFDADSTGANDGKQKDSRIGLSAQYKINNITVGGAYESNKKNTNTTVAKSGSTKTMGLTVQADISPAVQLRGGYAKRSGDTVSATAVTKDGGKGTVYALGADYKMGKGAKVFAEVEGQSKEIANSGAAGSPKAARMIQLGMRLDF